MVIEMFSALFRGSVDFKLAFFIEFFGNYLPSLFSIFSDKKKKIIKI